MSDSKNRSSEMANSLSASGEDLPLLQPEMPAEQSASEGADISFDSPLDIPAENSDFSESNSVFSEIRNFGEGAEPAVGSEPIAGPQSIMAEVPSPKRTAAPRPTLVPSGDGSSEIPISSCDTLPGWRVEKYLGLVSAWASLEGEESDPVAQASAQLAMNALARGANAVISVRLQPTGIQGRALLLVGTAVVGSAE